MRRYGSKRKWRPSTGAAVVGAVGLAASGLILSSYGAAAFLGGAIAGASATVLGFGLGRNREQGWAARRQRSLVDGIGPMVMLVDGQGRIEHANRSADDLLGTARKPLAGQLLDGLDWIDASDRSRLSALIGRAAMGETVRGDASLRTASGRRVDLDMWMRPVEHGERLNRIAVSAVDVTQRREGEDVQIALMQELDHRMKNTLHMVQAMIRRTSRSHRDVESFEKSLTGRIQAFSRSHEILARERWLGAPLRTVIREALSVSLEDDTVPDPRVDLDGPRIRVEPRAALTLGLVVHELAANAAAHGALSDPDGRVAVRWKVEEGETPILAIDWRETHDLGIPRAAAEGFGRHFVDRAVRYELDGDVEASFAADGLECRIRLPLQRVTERSVHTDGSVLGPEEVAA